MSELFNHKVIDSAEGYTLLAVYKAHILNSPVVCYHLRHDDSGAIEIFESHNLSYAEQRLDDLANAGHYKNLAAMPMFGKGKRRQATPTNAVGLDGIVDALTDGK